LLVEIGTEFHILPAAFVMLVTSETVMEELTKYAVPVSVLLTFTEPELPFVWVVTVAVGADVSIVIDALVTVALGFHLLPALSEMMFLITGYKLKSAFPVTPIEIVPSEVHTTVNVIEVPAVAFG
jgi:hypothetical protein